MSDDDMFDTGTVFLVGGGTWPIRDESEANHIRFALEQGRVACLRRSDPDGGTHVIRIPVTSIVRVEEHRTEMP
jgi:hypothetical protein